MRNKKAFLNHLKKEFDFTKNAYCSTFSKSEIIEKKIEKITNGQLMQLVQHAEINAEFLGTHNSNAETSQRFISRKLSNAVESPTRNHHPNRCQDRCHF